MSAENTNETANNEVSTLAKAIAAERIRNQAFPILNAVNNAKSTRGRVEARRKQLEAESSKTSAKKTVVTYSDVASKDEAQAISLANTWEKLEALLKKAGIDLTSAFKAE